jgi:hypothetical protein
MTIRMTHAAALAALIGALPLAAPAHAAQVDYYLKIPDIEGESTAMKPGIEPDEIDARAAARARGDGHKDWIDLLSFGFAGEPAAYSGGVNVATGDVSGDGTRDSASGMATGKRQHKPFTVTKPVDKASPGAQRDVSSGEKPQQVGLLLPAVQKVRSAASRSESDAGGPGDVSSGEDPQPLIGLLLPAVQKVRVASARRPDGVACREGAHYDTAFIREGMDGPVHRVGDVTITGCTSEQISLNFTKVKF